MRRLHIRKSWLVLFAAIACAVAPVRGQSTDPASPVLAAAPVATLAEVDFERDIRPIFATRCLSCHGPDMAEGSLRLDVREAALAGGNSGVAIVRGESAKSRLIAYVTGENDDGMLMPPEGEPLAAAEIDMLRKWIDAGARWPEAADARDAETTSHWSFQPIRRVEPPAVQNTAWVRNEIDRFVLARLESQGIAPSAEAARETLIRRLSIDLLGLPPTPAEVDDFLADKSDDAYERVVDRLLASPHYGERWGRNWLDLARYADSDGYEKDTGRPYAWRFRDWVINAINRDLPFDRFTIEQLAGDLLPQATTEQLVATGFHRNTLRNREGGVDQEEYRVAATVDRVNTTGSVWLGLTVGCAQCHSHKYDPIAQREYYGMFAFFNSLDEVDIPAPSDAQLAAYGRAKAAFDREHEPFVRALERYERTELAKRAAEWEAKLDLDRAAEWTVLDRANIPTIGNVRLIPQEDGSFLAKGADPEKTTYTVKAQSPLGRITALRIELLPDESLAGGGPGRSQTGSFVLTDFKLAYTGEQSGKARTLSAKIANAMADESTGRWSVDALLDAQTRSGWKPSGGTPHAAVFEFEEPLVLAAEKSNLLTITLDQQFGQNQTIGRFRLSVTDTPAPFAVEGLRGGIVELLRIAPESRTDKQRDSIARYYRTRDAKWRHLRDALEQHARKAPVDPAETMKAQALVDLSQPRATHILMRGNFLDPGAEVDPHTLAVLHPLERRDDQPDRLDLARWLVDPANPLTSRVTVNRVWARRFGRGLVATLDDFGTQGEKPSHPELLDWLAAEFMARGWSLKSLDKLIVMSAAYRQSSAVREDLTTLDPYNVLLARQHRVRVEAEVIRDLALATSGLLDPTVGGPSVRPPQPEGISALTYNNAAKWVESGGGDRYRRGMYTWFQRTSPYPMLMTFDAPDSNVTCARRERSNTPLQALTLLNDPVFFEFAQGMARRIVAEAPQSEPTADARLEYAFRLCVARRPGDVELADLRALHAAALAACQADPEGAEQLVGPLPRPDGAACAELASWVVVSRTLMNLDEFITRE